MLHETIGHEIIINKLKTWMELRWFIQRCVISSSPLSHRCILPNHEKILASLMISWHPAQPETVVFTTELDDAALAVTH